MNNLTSKINDIGLVIDNDDYEDEHSQPGPWLGLLHQVLEDLWWASTSSDGLTNRNRSARFRQTASHETAAGHSSRECQVQST